MTHRSTSITRKQVKVSLREGLLEEAKSYGINISAVVEAQLRTTVPDARIAQWAKENATGIAALNKFIKEEGFPLANLALFKV